VENQLTQNEVEQILEAAKTAKERRGAVRWPYPFLQAVAAYDGLELPRRKDLQKVLCQDLSTTGISLLISETPQFEHLVVRLGRVPSVVYVTARVVRAVPQTGGDGFVLGCSFLGKVTLGL
jgi:hypothetical protein